MTPDLDAIRADVKLWRAFVMDLSNDATVHCDTFDYACDHIDALLAEVGRLAVELNNQWKSNHDEFCSNMTSWHDCPDCHCPPPDVLRPYLKRDT
jgi:hypothetical protein